MIKILVLLLLIGTTILVIITRIASTNITINSLPANTTKQLQNLPKKSRITIYKSRRIESTIEIPSDFEVKEKNNSVTLTSKDGVIFIHVVGTNYDNPEDYLNTLAELNHRQITNKRYLLIDNKPAIFAKNSASVINETSLAYIIYFDYWIITIETDSPSLSRTLDQIALSYKKS